MATTVRMRLEEIKRDPKFQFRKEVIDPELVRHYVEALQNGATFPPLICYALESGPTLVDGNHRDAAYQELGHTDTLVTLTDGTEEEAANAAIAANNRHGKPYTGADREKIAHHLFARHAGGVQPSHRELAKIVGVSHTTIGAWHRQWLRDHASEQLETNLPVDAESTTETRTLGADGKERDTSGISGANRRRAEEDRERKRLAREAELEQIRREAIEKAKAQEQQRLADLLKAFRVGRNLAPKEKNALVAAGLLTQDEAFPKRQPTSAPPPEPEPKDLPFHVPETLKRYALRREETGTIAKVMVGALEQVADNFPDLARLASWQASVWQMVADREESE